MHTNSNICLEINIALNVKIIAFSDPRLNLSEIANYHFNMLNVTDFHDFI